MRDERADQMNNVNVVVINYVQGCKKKEQMVSNEAEV